VADATPLDSTWLREHPLPDPDAHADKNARGRVFIVGGCARVPGGLLLTAEAALRAGAGKVQVATAASTALALGVAMPEIAVFPLPEDCDGEITCIDDKLETVIARSDAVVIGPAMSGGSAAGSVVDRLLQHGNEAPLILDAAALMELPSRATALAAQQVPAILTPHIGEMAALLECEAAEIEADRPTAVRRAAKRYGAVVTLKGSTSFVADREGALFAYAGGGVGLATGGSGDVLAGIAAGLVARGAPPLEAALWAVWLHGEAGRRCAVEIGPIGFLARELLGHVPGLMHAI
jgi:ADP-dependent NAD(P)H-hydrate dehydratase